MEAQEKNNQDYSIYFLLAAICGIATAWVITGSLFGIIKGLLLGLIGAGFFVNFVLKSSKKD